MTCFIFFSDIVLNLTTVMILFQVEASQQFLQTRVDAAANEIRAFARGYASAVEAHCLSLLHRLEELRIQRRYGATTRLVEGTK